MTTELVEQPPALRGRYEDITDALAGRCGEPNAARALRPRTLAQHLVKVSTYDGIEPFCKAFDDTTKMLDLSLVDGHDSSVRELVSEID